MQRLTTRERRDDIDIEFVYCNVDRQFAIKKLADYEDMEEQGRLIILPAPVKKGEPKPKCYSEMPFCKDLCNSYSSGDDEPTERCKNCWYCEFSYARLEEVEWPWGANNE